MFEAKARNAPGGSFVMTPARGIRLDVHDRPGVLARVALVFHRQGINIERLLARPTGRSGCSTIWVEASFGDVRPGTLCKRLDKLIDVVRVESGCSMGLVDPAAEVLDEGTLG